MRSASRGSAIAWLLRVRPQSRGDDDDGPEKLRPVFLTAENPDGTLK
jgi:hypothetical protein